MDTSVKFPFYAKASLFLIGLYVFTAILYLTQDVILPLIYATGVAIQLSPVIGFLAKKGINRVVAIAGVLIIAVLIVGALIALLVSQASMLRTAWPHLVTKLHEFINQVVDWVSGYLNLSPDKINGWISETTSEFMKNRNAAIGVTLTTMSGILSATILTPVYIFMILFYQPHLLAFVHNIFGADNDKKVSEILTETRVVVKGYIGGLFGEFVIIAILNSIGLLILKMDYAILLGVIGAVLNVIPIIGGIICIALFVIIALLTKSPLYIIYVLGLYALIQFIDDHYIFPRIVGAKVKLNLLISIIAVIVGDALWGIPGMFLAIPITAVLKIIFDRVETLKSWGFLFGDTIRSTGKSKFSLAVNRFIKYLISKFHKPKHPAAKNHRQTG